jgi:hypothetical protein
MAIHMTMVRPIHKAADWKPIAACALLFCFWGRTVQQEWIGVDTAAMDGGSVDASSPQATAEVKRCWTENKVLGRVATPKTRNNNDHVLPSYYGALHYRAGARGSSSIGHDKSGHSSRQANWS